MSLTQRRFVYYIQNMKPRLLATTSPTVIEFILLEEGPWHESKRGPRGMRLYSSRNSIRAAANLFENLPVQVITRNVETRNGSMTLFDHIPENEKVELGAGGNKFYVSEIKGFIRNPRVEEINGKMAVVGPVHFHDEKVAQTLRAAIEAGDYDFVGGSIDGTPNKFEVITVENEQYEEPWIESLDTWDLATFPAAGGRMLRLAASRNINNGEQEMKLSAKMKAALVSLLHAAGVNGDMLEKVFAEEADFGKESISAIKDALKGKPELLSEFETLAKKLEEGTDVDFTTLMLKLAEKPKEEPKPQAQAKVEPKPEPAKEPENKTEDDETVKKAEEILGQAQKLQEQAEAAVGEAEIDKHVTASRLPDLVQDKLRESLRASRVFKAAEIKAAIDKERKYLSDATKGRFDGERIIASVEPGMDSMDHLLDRAQTMFRRQPLYNKKKELVKPITSFREYWRLTASQDELDKGYDPERFFRRLGARLSAGHELGFNAFDYIDPETGRITASLDTSDWAEIFASTMHRQMATDYKVDQFQDWRKICEVTNFTDLRTRYFARLGGYPAAPAVAEGGTYQNVTSSPTDESSALSISKYGHIEDITEEMIINDDLRSVAMLTQRLGRGMAIDVYRMVFDPITNNDAVAYGSDTDTLVHSNHSNGAASAGSALSDTTFEAGYNAMIAQSAYNDSRAYLDNEPKYIICGYLQARKALWIANPDILTQAATASGEYPSGSYLPNTGLTNPHANGLVGVIPLKHISSSTNWWMMADPMSLPTILVGFHQGKDQPEIVTEASGTGAQFTADTIRMKVKLRRGAVIHDHRGIYGQIA